MPKPHGAWCSHRHCYVLLTILALIQVQPVSSKVTYPGGAPSRELRGHGHAFGHAHEVSHSSFHELPHTANIRYRHAFLAFPLGAPSLNATNIELAWPYKFFFPLVLMHLSAAQQTTAWIKQGADDGGYNQLLSVRKTPDANFKLVVKPNLDTLYTSAWLDLEAEPIVLTVPSISVQR